MYIIIAIAIAKIMWEAMDSTIIFDNSNRTGHCSCTEDYNYYFLLIIIYNHVTSISLSFAQLGLPPFHYEYDIYI